MRFLLMALFLGVIVWLGLHQCTNVTRSTLVLNPSDSFPADKKQALGQNVARILPHCPGLQKLGAVLEFTNLTEQDGVTVISLHAPDNADIPAEWGARGRDCAFRISQSELDLGSNGACQALCLGKLGSQGLPVKKNLARPAE